MMVTNGWKGAIAMLYCDRCMVQTEEQACPNCGTKKLRTAQATDPVFLIAKDAIWAGMVEDILNQNSIPFLKKGTLGAGLATKIGYAMEAYRFYVPQDIHGRAVELLASVFPDIDPER